MAQPASQGVVKNGDVDGFRYVIVHADGQAAFPVAGQGIGGHGDDGQLPGAGQPAYGFGGGVAIHDRHVAIHQDQVVGSEFCLLKGNLAVFSRFHTEADAAQHFLGQFAIDFVVFDEQHALA